jgi:autotransporter passenger strand-loop-strand repeat protein
MFVFGGTAVSANIGGGGTLNVGLSGGGKAIGTVVQSGATVNVLRGGIASGTLINAGGQESVLSGGTDQGAKVSAGGLLLLNSGGVLATGALVQLLSGGTAIVSGVLINSGTLVASGASSLLEIASGAVVKGGTVMVGDGIVDVLSGGTANVSFLATGNGGLEIADSHANSSTFTGKISGFGGSSHSNHNQFIDLVSVTFVSNTISFGYASSAGGGTLFVSSGGAVVAAISMIGSYTLANFSAKEDSDHSVEIVDPAVPNGGIASGAQTTLAYPTNGANTGASLTVTNGGLATAIALLGNYMAAAFAAAGPHGGSLLTGALDAEQKPLLTRPHG